MHPAEEGVVSTLNYSKGIAKAAKLNFFNKSDNVKQAAQDGTQERGTQEREDRYARNAFHTAAYPEIKSKYKNSRKNETSSNTHLYTIGNGAAAQKAGHRKGTN